MASTENTSASVVERHESGLVFERSNVAAFDSLKGKTGFGQLLNRPEFRTVEEFAARIGKLDGVELRRVAYLAPDGRWTEAPGYRATVGRNDGKFYAVTSDSYHVVQDHEVALPFLAAAQERGLSTIGRITQNGQTTGHVVLANPEFRIRLLDDHDEDMMLGVRFWNSYKGDRSFGAELFGVRVVCINYNLWGTILGTFSFRHAGDVAKMLTEYEALLNKALDASSILRGVAEKALAIEVASADVESLLWSVGLGLRAVKAVSTNPASWCPEIKTAGLNAWTLYQATTAYLTHGKPFFARAMEDQSRSATKLLTAAHDQLIVKGAAIRERQEEERKARKAEAKKPGARASPVAVATTGASS